MLFTGILSKRKVIAALSVATVGVALLAVPEVSNASPLSPPSPNVSHGHLIEEVQTGLNVGGFNVAVAEAHGYKIVTYANGDQQSVPVDPNSHSPKSPILHHSSNVSASSGSEPTYGNIAGESPQSIASPDGNYDYNKAVGNCGTSWIAVTQTGHYNVQVASGFTVYTGTIGHDWVITLSDENGTSTQSDDGHPYITGTSWARTWTNLYQYISTYDFISDGVAQLDDGTVCFAGRPDVHIFTT